MIMNRRCLYCCETIETGEDFHKKCAVEFFGTPFPPRIEYSYDQMAELAKKVVERSVTVPGVQPKLSLSLIRESGKNSDARLTVVGALGGQYILKPPAVKYPEMPENEHATMKMAQAFGIQTAPSSLIRLASGELCYITKRVDRTESGEKIHMIDMFQITEANDKYKSSMERIGKALKTYSSNPFLDQTFFFDMTLFSFITGNNDMHLKNFSMIENPSGWVLSPAYDLLNVALLIPEDREELALSITGRKRKLKRENFDQFGEALGLTTKQITRAYDRLKSNKNPGLEWIHKSFLSKAMKQDYQQLLEERYAQILG